MQMRKAILLSVGFLAFTTAYATDNSKSVEKKALDKITCEQFLAVEDVYQPKVIYWAVAHAQKGKPGNAIVNIEGTEKIIPIVIDACKKEPKASFWDKVKEEVKKVF